MDAQEKKYRDIKSSTEFYKERQERYNSILEEREVIIDENGNRIFRQKKLDKNKLLKQQKKRKKKLKARKRKKEAGVANFERSNREGQKNWWK